MGFNLAEHYIQEAEDVLGATLPNSYRVAMMANNGRANEE
jgi:hypothetical protein